MIGLVVGTGRNAKEAGFRIDGVKAGHAVLVLTRLDPGDVVANRGDLPALQPSRRNQHGKVGLAAGRGEGRCHIMLLAFGRLDAENQHMLGQPAILARHRGSDAQGKAFFAEQRIAAIA